MAALPAFAEPVERVDVQIIDNGATSRVLLDRMGKSMQVVAEQIFVDKDSVSINAARGDYERLLAEVGDRVLTGYQMQSVSVNAGAVTQSLTFRLRRGVQQWMMFLWICSFPALSRERQSGCSSACRSLKAGLKAY